MVVEPLPFAPASSAAAPTLLEASPLPIPSAGSPLLELVHHLPYGLLLLRPEGTIACCTSAWGHLLALPRPAGQWEGQSLRQLSAYILPRLTPESAAEVGPWLAAAGTGATPVAVHLHLRTGAVLVCEAASTPPGVLLTLRDASADYQRLRELTALAELAEHSPQPMVHLAPGRRPLYANAAARELGSRLTRAERVRVQRQLRAYFRADTSPSHPELQLNQRTFALHCARPPRHSGVHLYLSDITDHLAMRRELAAQQQFTEQVLDTIPCAVFVVDSQHQVIFQNRTMRELIQASPFGEGQQSRTPEQTAREVADYQATNDLVRQTGQDVVREEPFTLANGITHWYYAVKRPLRRPDGDVHVLHVSLDITALKHTQQTLERSEKQYRDLMHYTQALICTYDMDGNVLSVNPALAQLLGRPAEQLVGKPVARHLPFDDRAAFADWMRHVASGTATKGVLRLQLPGTDETRHLLYHNVAVLEPEQPPYVISHSHDITDRVLAERETEKARLAAEKAVRARENFLANMSHEIRTPMNGVLGVANLLARTPLTAQQQEYLTTIRNSGQHLLAVLNDVLDMAKITSGKLELDNSPFNVCDSVAQTLHPLLLQGQEKGITFVTRPLHESCPMPWVSGDAHRLNQIMLNLVSNAIKFTPRGGTITIEGKMLRETATTLELLFSVQDTGIGMRPEVLSRIFESFTQAYSDTARRFGGTGLGLSISRALVERMGGTLQVDSSEGEGSRFAFTLELPKAQPATEPAEPESYDTGELQGKRVLLVEDNDINRFVARETMQQWGIVVTEADNGIRALELFNEQIFDVILMDIQMPGMSGLEATACIRQHPDPARAGMPMLALTANAFRADHEQYLAAGLNACLAKPFEEAELFGCLRSLLKL
ncbi:PAS domain-containing hybrid sensor histidine kinase/response regulator [Hymenobacter rigui]|uniref:histidine kinase n=1 Tax=Hymenobacter rigui TaxID=334424 RepID=A0A3R9NK92_9BACT|nr:PAS domain-containing hybrid sensor histidine kinase/response regulator [Hymenobacter rigui]RSK49054.1 PAS domain-containing sensor histidine kinase [Hymenobacter rigui]